MKTFFLKPACIAAAVLGMSFPAHATIITYNAALTGLQEVPPTTSPGTGSAIVTFDTVSDTLTVSETFRGLTAPTTAGSLQVGPSGRSGPVVLPFLSFPLGVTSGLFNGTFTAANLIPQPMYGINTFGDLVTAVEHGNTYLNIDTVLFPNGEIRGQVVPVPEPVTLSLLGVGLAGLGMARRRRQSAPPVRSA